MMHRLFALMLCVALLGLAIGCEKSENSTTPAPPPTSKAVYVLNGTGSSLSVIDLNTDVVTNNVVTCGTWPNQVVYFDSKLFVVNSGSNNVQVRDADTYALLGTIDLGANNNPMNIAVVSATKAYVTCLMSNGVKVVNPTTFQVLKTIPTGIGATGICVASNKVYVTNTASTYPTYGQGTVSVISTTLDTVIATINVSTNPQAAAVCPNGRVHVVCTGDYAATTGKVEVIDPATDAVVKTIDVGGSPGNIAISSSKKGYLGMFGTGVITYVTDTYVIVDSSTHPLLGKGGSGIAVDLSGNIYVGDFSNNQVIKMDNTHAVKKTYDVGQGPQSLAIK
jgi:YVTN family beta-propeller protein